jgi:hypothetical protein
VGLGHTVMVALLLVWVLRVVAGLGTNGWLGKTVIVGLLLLSVRVLAEGVVGLGAYGWLGETEIVGLLLPSVRVLEEDAVVGLGTKGWLGKTVMVALLLVLVQEVVLGLGTDGWLGRTVMVGLLSDLVHLVDCLGTAVGIALEDGVLEDTAPYVGVAKAVLEVNAGAFLELNDSDAGTSTEADGAGWSIPIEMLSSIGMVVEKKVE